jgi:hypothetical protein
MSSAMATSQAAKMEDAETRKSSKVSDEEKALSATDEGNIAQSGPKSNWNKPLRFYLAFLCLLLMVLMVSIDATALGVAIPVCSNELLTLGYRYHDILQNTNTQWYRP